MNTADGPNTSASSGDGVIGGAGPAFEIVVESYEPGVVLAVRGVLDLVTASQLTEAILAAMTDTPAAIIVDLTDVEFLASAGMTVLIAAHEEISRSARFAVVADGPATARPMKLVGIDRTVSIYPTRELALDAVSHA